MQVEDLNSIGQGIVLDTDLAIIGGGPAGLAIAREFAATSTQVLVLESGLLQEDAPHEDLNRVDNVGEPMGEASIRARMAFHGANSSSWSQETQGYGVRCRVLGGATHAWAGKSAALDAFDFQPRSWVPFSGWPFGVAAVAPFLDRAADMLNLGPNCYDAGLWELLRLTPPSPPLDARLVESCFWQFARSRQDRLDLMRVGPEVLRLQADNLRILLNATVTCIHPPGADAPCFVLDVASVDAGCAMVRARCVVLAASGIENPRLLLASNRTCPNGLGNEHGLVGRFLMDHPSARLGRFEVAGSAAIVDRFGFYGLRRRSQIHMYMHGLTLSREVQEREGLLHCAAYMMEERAPDDPWEALKRLLRATSTAPVADLLAVARSPGLLAKGLGLRLFQGHILPDAVKDLAIALMASRSPNFVVREFRARGLPHKLTGVGLDAITEQKPDPDSRITLSGQRDRLGVPLARVQWRIDPDAARSLARLGRILAAEFARVGLPVPELVPWVARDRPQDAVLIDMGHTSGTTRMADDPRSGVVDSRCRVHGVPGLYVAGASVFPTSGHANPTLMIVALAIRLADQIKADLAATKPARDLRPRRRPLPVE
ncbi:Glucose-methanol-choline (GMC) oxidoreductase:NAD binding site [Rhodovastum atsumiense]|uniref:GMC family oxidoreductase n=1 Tax=Rhodovastum atsumiense TaxID=504468 RepID=A0A5M6IST7_9PROT|nr:GMC family oxidoreductase [Rhodovastum atsumiense]KAA5611322.1 GMC family oxidoreductase [Rhodovastum atsumiense]CAH2601799.1 Glucose-methanol-choline (GMC) oxidoreductase:NAD binding site [Rhodovastum atsumiense]